jgi:uncharacterized protein YndB with AHSA1/START domain
MKPDLQQENSGKARVQDGRITLILDLDGRPEEVFNLLTDPREFEQWWGSEETYRMTHWIQDFQPGGHYKVDVRNKDGHIAPAHGTFVTIDPPGKFVYTRNYDWDFPELGRNETTISYIINKSSEGTRLIVIHEGFAKFPGSAREHAAGWERVMGWLTEWIKKKKK